jgi:hypothetical protein
MRILRLNGRSGDVTFGNVVLTFRLIKDVGPVAEYPDSGLYADAIRARATAAKGYQLLDAGEAPAPAVVAPVAAPATPVVEPAAPEAWQVALNNGWKPEDLTGGPGLWHGGLPSAVSGLSIADMAMVPPPERWAEVRHTHYAWEEDDFRPPFPGWRPGPHLAPRRATASKPVEVIPAAPAAPADPSAPAGAWAGDKGALAKIMTDLAEKGSDLGLNKINALLKKAGQPPMTDEQFAATLSDRS